MTDKSKENSRENFQSSLSKITTDLNQIYEDLSDARNEKNDILHFLDEGVFFLNREFEIDGDYSESFEKLVEEDNLKGKNFINFLEKRIPENEIKNAHEYLSLMFKDDLDEETISELNPLILVEFHFEDDWGLWTSSKHLSFKFKRIKRNDIIHKLVAIVKDFSENVTLSKKLEQIEENTRKQMEWLVNLLHVEPPLLKEFIDVSEHELQYLDKQLKSSKDKENYTPVLERILRTIHQLHSNASLLNLNFFLSKLRMFESEILKMKQKKEINGSDFIPTVIKLGDIRQMLADMKNLMYQLKHFKSSLRPNRTYEGEILIRTIENLVQNLAQELGREIKFNYQNFDSAIIPYEYQQIVREFLIILIRFSILYGIEKPDERRAANKKPVGTLEIETFIMGRIFGFKLRHDGRLIRIERLLQKTIESTDAEMSEETKSERSGHLGAEVIRLLFMPSMATSSLTEAEYSKEIFADMEMVKKKLKMHRGKIKITFTSENFCEYTISFPKK